MFLMVIMLRLVIEYNKQQYLFSYTCEVNIYHDIINIVYILYLYNNETVSQCVMKQMPTAVSISPDNSHDTEPSFSSKESHLITFNDLIHPFDPT